MQNLQTLFELHIRSNGSNTRTIQNQQDMPSKQQDPHSSQAHLDYSSHMSQVLKNLGKVNL